MSSRQKGLFSFLLLLGSLIMAVCACNSANQPAAPGLLPTVHPPCSACTSTPTPTITGTSTFTNTPTNTATGTITPTPTITGTSTATPTITSTQCPSVVGQNTGANSGYFYGSQIVATLYSMPATQTLRSLWVPISYTSGGSISVALYGDSGLGYPGSLLEQSQPQPLVTGLIRLPIPAITLPPGNYWLAVQIGNPIYYYYTNLPYNYSGLATDKYVSDYQSFGKFPTAGAPWNRGSGYLYDVIATSCQ